MSISSILNSVHINEYANPASRKITAQNNISDELLVNSKTIKSISSEKLNDIVSEKTDQNPNTVDYLRYQATATVANPEQNSRIYNETRKVKNPGGQKDTEENPDTDENSEYEIVEDDIEIVAEDNLGKGFFIIMPEDEHSSSLKLIKHNVISPLYQKMIDAYKLSERREIGQLTDLIF